MITHGYYKALPVTVFLKSEPLTLWSVNELCYRVEQLELGSLSCLLQPRFVAARFVAVAVHACSLSFL